MTFDETRQIVYAALRDSGGYGAAATKVLLRRTRVDNEFNYAMAEYGVDIFQELIDAQYATVH